MPRGDTTGPKGTGPKTPNQGIPTPRRDGTGGGNGNIPGVGGGLGRGGRRGGLGPIKK